MSGPAATAERDEALVPTPPASTVNPEAYWQVAPLALGTPDPNLDDVEPGAAHREPGALAG